MVVLSVVVVVGNIRGVVGRCVRRQQQAQRIGTESEIAVADL